MASFSGSPAEVAWTGGAGTFEPARFSGSPAIVRWVGVEASFSIIEAAAIPQIERLRRFEDRFGERQTTTREQIVQQRNAEGIEDAFATVNKSIAALDSMLNLILATQSQVTTLDDKLTVEGSYTDPVSIGSASSAGVVTIAAHTRKYAGTGGASVSVNAGSVSGLTQGDYVTVFYRDAAQAGGAVTYEASTSAIAQTGNIHIVWQGQIPLAGEPTNPGTSPSGPGYVPPQSGNPDYLEP